jgi:phosphate transport system substrate-binding protein
LVESWLNDSERPYFVPRRVQFFLSRHGFADLAAGECDLACTDRPISVRERDAFGERRVAGYRVGFYGYGLYVHPDNPLDSIFAGHLKYLFQKKVSDWRELGGNNVDIEGPIRLIGPHKGTRGGEILARQARIWFGDPTWEPLDSDAQIVAAVAADPLALGFAGIGFDQDARYLGLRMERRGRAAFPSIEEIESERYGLAKVIYVYFEDPPSESARAVLDYLFSDPGRAAIESTRVWPVPQERALVHRSQ